MPRILKKRVLKANPSRNVIKKAVNKAKVNNIQKIVKSVLNKKSETKFAMQNFTADAVSVGGCGLNYNGAAFLLGWSSGPGNGYGILPAIPQGDGQGDRSGTKIQPTYAYLRYTLTARPTTDSSYTTNDNPFRGLPFRVRVIIYRHRYAQDDYGQAGLMQIGNNATYLTGDLDTWLRPYNTDEYRIVYSKDHRMSAMRHLSSLGYTVENMANSTKHFVVGKAKIPLPKVLKFNDFTGSSDYATNAAYFVAVAVINDDGSNITTSQKRVQFTAESGMYFKDI